MTVHRANGRKVDALAHFPSHLANRRVVNHNITIPAAIALLLGLMLLK
jgi:hypothetical protein